MLNEAGPIAKVADVILCYKGHSERAVFAVTAIRNEDIILGLPWLKEHNPEVKMSCCPARCMTCRDKVRQEKHKRRTHHECIARCRTGPMPHPHVMVEEVEEEEDMFTHNDLLELQEDPEDSDD